MENGRPSEQAVTGTVEMLAFGAHPDDVEIGMGGTAAKHANAGRRFGICDLTLAELSSNGDAELRQVEAAAASKALGISYRSNLRLPDRGLRLTDDHVRRIVREIRKLQPRVVFAPYWQDRHPDHIACSELIQEAVFNAKLRKYDADAPAWTVERLYFYFINDVYTPDAAVDVGEVYVHKQKALRAYKSQFVRTGEHDVATPLNQGYVERVEMRDALMGGTLGVAYAEGFATKLPQLLSLF